jgi:hypothetical protein
MAPLIVRLYPTDRRYGLWVRVEVYRTRREMHRAIRRWGRVQSAVRGLCSGVWVRPRGGRLNGCFAEVYLNRANLGQEVITHELDHAAFCWARRKRISLGREKRGPGSVTAREMLREEAFCHAHGRMVRQFVDWAYRRKLFG